MSIINNLIINSIAFLPRKMVKLVADKYVAGQSSEDVLSKTKELNSKGYELTIDLLGEHISTEKETNQITDIYLKILDKIYERNLTANISVKPTHIGLDISPKVFENNALKLVQKASKHNNFVRFDMENSSTTDNQAKKKPNYLHTQIRSADNQKKKQIIQN